MLVAKKVSVVLFLIFVVGNPLFSFEKISVIKLTESIVLTEPVEYHISSSNDALGEGVVVSLNHEDAWLFFENIKPSVVASKYFNQIKINGNSFSDGVNGRMAIYAHGTVIMPHNSVYSPLTVYTEPNFEGSSASYRLHTYYDNLGEFNYSIKSFKLKRGYQATFATNSDGSGYSRVFIADKEDIEMSVMPELLDGAIAFIRVFKHQWVTKKGWCGWNWDDFQSVNATWYYDWNADGSTSQNLEYTPIKQHGHWPSWSTINGKSNVSHLLGFNEPDRPDQSNLDFEDALAMWPEYMKSGLRLGSPATADPFNGWSLFNFIDKCDELNYRVDYVAIHAYWAKSPQQWYNDLKYVHEKTGRPIWITEWNNGANWTNESWPAGNRGYNDLNAQKQLNDLKKILEVLDTTSFVERYAIYNWVEDARAMTLNGSLTLAGEYYANNKSKIAYNSKNEVIPKYSYRTPEIEAPKYIKRSNGMRVEWNDPNGKLSKSYKLEKRIGAGEFQEIENVDFDLGYHIDIINPDEVVAGEVVYRLGIKTYYDEWIYSDIASYYQTEGNELFQVGSFPVRNLDWNFTMFSEEMDVKDPEVLLSPISFGGIMQAMTTRAVITTNNSTDIKIKAEPWKYISKPVVTVGDSVSLFVSAAGNYDFGGLKAEIGRTARIKKEWTHIEFTQTFDKVPVVLATQITNAAMFPTTISISNVTKEGFDIRVKSEQAITLNTVGDNVSYFAIEPGYGAIGENRIYVGKLNEQDYVASETFKIQYSEKFKNPLMFAGFQTDENSFTSTVRYYKTKGTSNEYSVFRHREMSGPLAVAKKDGVGWMIMDISPNQPLKIEANEVSDRSLFYPNPVADILRLNVKNDKNIIIYNLQGEVVYCNKGVTEVNLSHLLIGVYMLHIEGENVSKIIKK